MENKQNGTTKGGSVYITVDKFFNPVHISMWYGRRGLPGVHAGRCGESIEKRGNAGYGPDVL